MAWRGLDLWLKRNLIVAEEGPISRFELRQVVSGGPGGLVDRWPIDADKVPDPETLALEIEGRAYQDAENTFEGITKYIVFAYFGKDPNPKSRSPSLTTFANKLGAAVEETEPATTPGIVTQLMRQNEQLHRVLVGSTAAILTAQTETMRALGEQLNEYRLREQETLRLRAELLGDKGERMIALENAHTDNELKQKTWEKIELVVNLALQHWQERKLALTQGCDGARLGPSALGNSAGGPSTPDATSASSGMGLLSRLAEVLAPEQLQALSKLITPEQLLDIMRRFGGEPPVNGPTPGSAGPPQA